MNSPHRHPVQHRRVRRPRPRGHTAAQAGAPPQPPRTYIQHGGSNGFQKRVWDAVAHDGPEPSLALTIKEADGTGGFPGNITVTVTYTVRADNTLVLDYKGTTDKRSEERRVGKERRS